MKSGDDKPLNLNAASFVPSFVKPTNPEGEE